MTGPPRPARRWFRRVVVGVVVALQLSLVTLAYHTDHPVFGFQMFPESTDWRAEIVRVTVDGRAVDVREEWPGGYSWGTLVQGRGLGSPFRRAHADAGLASSLDFLDHALDWVADHTPEDTETLYLQARVTYWENGRAPQKTVLRSEDRHEAGR